MLNHECDITKLLTQVEAFALANPLEKGSEVNEADMELLFEKSKPVKKKPKSKAQQGAETALAQAKDKLKSDRKKLIETTQSKLAKLATADGKKAMKKAPPTVPQIVASTIAKNHKEHPDDIKAMIHQALGTHPTSEIDGYLDEQIELYKHKRLDSLQKTLQHKADASNKAMGKKAERKAEQEARSSRQEGIKQAFKDKDAAEIKAYREAEADKKAERMAWRNDWKAKQKQYNEAKRKERQESTKAYAKAFKDLIDGNPDWKQGELRYKLLEAVANGDSNPETIKRDFKATTGLAYLGQGDIKGYLERIDAAKKIKDPYQKNIEITKIQKDLKNEIPNLWSDWLISQVRVSLLSSPAGGLRDIIGTTTEGQLLSGAKPLLPNVAIINKHFKEAMQGISTLHSNVAMGEAGHEEGDSLRFPEEWRKVLGSGVANKAEQAFIKFARINDAARNSVAKAMYEQHYQQVIDTYSPMAKTPEEMQAVQDYAHTAGAMATYSPIPSIVKRQPKIGYLLGMAEQQASQALDSLNGIFSKVERNKANSQAVRVLAGATRVTGTSIMPFAGFMVRLATRTATMHAAPYVAAGKLAQLTARAAKARSLNVRATMTVEEAMQTDAMLWRGGWSLGGTALLAGLIEAGAVIMPDDDGEDDKRTERSVGIYAPQLNVTQLTALLSGAKNRQTQENDLVLSLAFAPMVSVSLYLANGYRKGVKSLGDGEASRLFGNQVFKAFEALVLDTPANKSIGDLMKARNEEGEKDIGAGVAKIGRNLAVAPIPLLIRRPIEIVAGDKRKPPEQGKATLPAILDAETRREAKEQPKHEREQELSDEWGDTTYRLATLLNSYINPMNAELVPEAKAIVADFERRNIGKRQRENEADENLLKAKGFKFMPKQGKALPFSKAGRIERAERRAKRNEL